MLLCCATAGSREPAVVVRVRASSVNPVDNAIAAGMLGGMFEHEFPVVLGRDYAGVVERAGAGVSGFAPRLIRTGAFDAALKDGGRVASPNSAAGDGSDRFNVMAVPSRENLERLGALLADGTLRVPVQDTYDLAQATEALGVLGGSHTQGKLALRVS